MKLIPKPEYRKNGGFLSSFVGIATGNGLTLSKEAKNKEKLKKRTVKVGNDYSGQGVKN